jgi:hypothetical protein
MREDGRGGMIVVELCGGLGNQLFQYAAGRSVADRLEVDLGLDVRPLRPPADRRFGLAPFSIRARIVPDGDLRGVHGGSLRFGWRARARGFMDAGAAWFCRPAMRGLRPVVHQEPTFSDVLSRVTDGSWLEGFWQSERYFESNADRIRADLTLRAVGPATAGAEAEIESLEYPVAVHVRRGDYASVPTTRAYHGLCGLDYYEAAIARVLHRHPEATFLLFSDDPAWVAAHLVASRRRIMASDGAAHEDLYLMSRCRAHIIANSSFSWWGAWLARSELVIAPRRWFQGADGNAVVPERWVRL